MAVSLVNARPLRPVEEVSSTNQQCLFPGELVNGDVISAYFRLIERRSCNRPQLPHTIAVSSYFFTLLRTSLANRGAGFERARRHHKGLNLLDFDLVLIPVHEPLVGRSGHWWLVVVDTRTNTISAYDSVPGRGPLHDLGPVEDYMRFQARITKPERPERRWLRWEGRPCPRQESANDCGIFLCAIATEIAIGGPLADFQVDVKEWRKRISQALRASALADDQPATNSLFPGEVDWEFEMLALELERLMPPIPMDPTLSPPGQMELERDRPNLLEMTGMAGEIPNLMETEGSGEGPEPPQSPALSLSPGLQDWFSVASTASFEVLSLPDETQEAELPTPAPQSRQPGEPSTLQQAAERPVTPLGVSQEPVDHPLRLKKSRGKRRTMKVRIPGTDTFKRINIRRLGLTPFKR